MLAKRRIEVHENQPAAKRCRCGRVAVYTMVTEAEMRGIYLGLGKTRLNRTYRCDDCIHALAAEFGLKVPEPCGLITLGPTPALPVV